MKRVLVLALSLTAWLAAADKPSREVQELQRDVAQLQEIVKTLQRSFEERVAGLGTQVQGATDAAGKAVAASAQVQRSIDQLSKELEQKLAPLNTLGGRVDQLKETSGSIQQSVADLTSVVNKLVTQVGDLTMIIKAGQAGPEKVAAPGPAMSATDMFTNAERDQMSGKPELALSEFEEYLKWYGDSPRADMAWYAIGSIQLGLKDAEKAVTSFDTVLTKYPGSAKTPEALFYKAKALDALGRTKEAIDVRLALRRRFPKNPLATQR